MEEGGEGRGEGEGGGKGKGKEREGGEERGGEGRRGEEKEGLLVDSGEWEEEGEGEGGGGKKIMSCFMSFGLDAHITKKFNDLREGNPDLCKSRNGNKVYFCWFCSFCCCCYSLSLLFFILLLTFPSRFGTLYMEFPAFLPVVLFLLLFVSSLITVPFLSPPPLRE